MTKEKFGLVHSEVMQDPNLSIRAKGVYALLCTYANKDRECYPSNTTLSEMLGVSRRTLQRTLRELEEKNYVRRKGKVFTVK